MKTTITLPASIEITDRAGETVTLNIAEMDKDAAKEIALRAIVHGITQKVNDAASSALDAALPAEAAEWDTAQRRQWGADNKDKVQASRTEMRQAAVDQLFSGEWGITRAAATPVDPVDTHRLAVASEYMASPASHAKLALKGYNDIPSKDQKERREYKLNLVRSIPQLEQMAQARHESTAAFASIEI